MLQYTALQDDIEWKKKLCIFSYLSWNDREPFSASAAVTGTSAYVLNPLMPEDLKHLTAFPRKATRSFTL